MREELEKELEDKSQEYKTGFTIGSLFAYTVAGCMMAVVIVIALKLMQWIWLL